MAINAADARQLSRVILLAYGEDLHTIAAILRPLRVQWTTIAWMTELSTIAAAWQPWLDSGLSIQWALNEIDRLSQP